jgi:small subunit ribosomal protein S5
MSDANNIVKQETPNRPNRENRPAKTFKGNREGGFAPREKEFKEKVVAINRISKTTKGGRVMRFAVLSVIGDGKGRVGFGTGKSVEIPDAIKKSLKEARKNVVNVKINKRGSISHEVIGKNGASKVLMKPANEGTGIVAGGAIRAVIELAGYTNVYTKNLGAKAPINMVRATVNGLLSIRTPKEIAKTRDKELKDL